MWRVAEAHPSFAEDAIHVWRVALDVEENAIAKYRALLSDDECVKADRYYFERDRRKYTVARGMLRTLLARYLGGDARRFVFAYGEHGKPSTAGINFNVSHSGEIALLAFTKLNIPLGVDVERVRTNIDLPGMARISFSPAERVALFALPAEEQLAAFYALWTRKEAYIKAIGLGLAMPLSGFTVTCTPQAELVRVESDAAEAARWTMWSFEAGRGSEGGKSGESGESGENGEGDDRYPCALAARAPAAEPRLAVGYFDAA